MRSNDRVDRRPAHQGFSDARRDYRSLDYGSRYESSGHRQPPSGNVTSSRVGDTSGSAASRSRIVVMGDGKAKAALIQKAIAVEEFGVVITLRPSFGFIQSVHSDEQVYFSEQDGYAGVKVDDFVAYSTYSTPKGVSADGKLRALNVSDRETVATTVLGTISRVPERHRSNYGLIEVEMPSLAEEHHGKLRRRPTNIIAYRTADVNTALFPRHATALDRGDFVEFTLSKIAGTSLYLATDVKLKQLKRDRERDKLVAQQIERLLKAGAVREIGIVTTIKNNEYGFIKAQDRKDEVYFRMDTVQVQEDEKPVREGSEVEFFVIAEMVRGKLSDRAMHLRPLPAGTVQFEVVVARDASVLVTSDPLLHPEEKPGMGKLTDPVSVEHVSKKSGDVLSEVEVWQRCCPDEMVCRRGDRLRVNVHYYRPEKLYFIRAVRLVEPLALGRDTGTVVAVRDAQGFGFISADGRKTDTYFRLNQVMSSTGEMLKRAEVTVGLRVSFDVENDGGKPRALRVMAQNPDSGSLSSDEAERLVIVRDVLGKVVRSTTAKKDSVGLILVSAEVWKEVQDYEYTDPYLLRALTDFAQKSFLSEHTVHYVTPQMRKQLCALIDTQFAHFLAYEVVNGDSASSDNSGGPVRHLRITRLNNTSSSSSAAAGGATTPPPAPPRGRGSATTTTSSAQPSTAPPKDGYTLSYLREDYATENLGPLGNDMEVRFTVVYDAMRGRKLCKDVRLTDEPVADMLTAQVGVVDVMVDRGEKFGFLRCLPSFEKLFWHSASAGMSSAEAGGLSVGQVVSFQARRRGGMRCATQLRLLNDQNQQQSQQKSESEVSKYLQEQMTAARATALVVSSTQVVLLDVDEVCELKDKLLPLNRLSALLTEHNPRLHQQWEKGVRAGGAAASATAASSRASAMTPPLPLSAPSPTVPVLKELERDMMSQEDKKAGSTGGIAEEGAEEVQVASSGLDGRVEYKAQYFPYLTRDLVPIRNPATASTSTEEGAAAVSEWKVGDVVSVYVHLLWTKAQPVVGVTVHGVVSEQQAAGATRNGTITKAKVRFTSMPAVTERHSVSQADFAEITEMEEIPISAAASAVAAATAPPPNASTTGNVVSTRQRINYYWFDMRELHGLDAGSSGMVEEDVEFLALPWLPNLALAVRVLVRTQKRQIFNTQGTRQVINDKLKEQVKVSGGAQKVTMAKGPPSDSALGFELGWRRVDVEATQRLPWAAMLSHLPHTVGAHQESHTQQEGEHKVALRAPAMETDSDSD